MRATVRIPGLPGVLAAALAAVACAVLAMDSDYDWKLPAWAPRPLVPADNPMSRAKAELGRYLFYDKRLSVNGSTSCATCHRHEAPARQHVVGQRRLQPGAYLGRSRAARAGDPGAGADVRHRAGRDGPGRPRKRYPPPAAR